MRFFERFRSAIARYADGVHQLEPPATRAAVDEAERRLGRALPDDYRDFLLQWDGGFLFHDDYELHGAARLTLDGERLRIGEAPGATLFLDGRGRLIAVDAQTEAERVEGSRFERWLDATMAREAVLYDRDGEFRDDAFDGGEVSERARRKRAQGAAKVDPESPAWREEQAELFVEEGARERAIAEYERAAALEPRLASAHFALGKLRRAGGEAAAAARDFRRAAEAEHDPEEAAFDRAQAARAAREAGFVDEAVADAGAVRRLDPRFVEQQREAARHLLDEGDVEGALERLGLALAVAPDDAELRALHAATRARQSLRVLE